MIERIYCVKTEKAYQPLTISSAIANEKKMNCMTKDAKESNTGATGAH